MTALAQLEAEMDSLRNPSKAALLRRFFKTGKGEYGEGDRFLGVVVPLQRQVVKKFKALPLADVVRLLKSGWHEHRLVALLIMVERFKAAVRQKDAAAQTRIVDLYLANTASINNWNLVDLSAPNILGCYLLDKDRKVLYGLARSSVVWERRIAVLAVFTFIRDGQFEDALRLARSLLGDKHDLIHKAVGWMLREVGKRNEAVLHGFLDSHAQVMPRTMLRYAIERLDERSREGFLARRA